MLHGDFTAPPGYRTRHDLQDLRNQCYCHGDRQEPPRLPMTDHTARAAWVDYAYVLEPERLRVLISHAGRWQPVAEPAWTDHPDWDVIDQHAQHLRRGVVATPPAARAVANRITVDMRHGTVPLQLALSAPNIRSR